MIKELCSEHQIILCPHYAVQRNEGFFVLIFCSPPCLSLTDRGGRREAEPIITRPAGDCA